jgi:hypothetical protein
MADNKKSRVPVIFGAMTFGREGKSAPPDHDDLG